MSKQPRRYRYRTLREDYVEFCDGHVVAALLLDYLASMERLHDEARTQGERPTPWRAISGKWGGLVTVLQPPPSRETIRRALDILIECGLVEAHPDNGRPAEPNTTPPASRYRLIAPRLLHMEREWAATSHGENADFDDGGSTQTLTPLASRRYTPSVTVAHDSVKSDIEEGGIHPPRPGNSDYPPEPAVMQVLRNDTAAHANGWTLVDSYATATGIAAETIYAAPGAKKVAAGLARSGITAEDVTAFMAELRNKPDRWNGYRFGYLAEDVPRWKQQQSERPAAPRVLSDFERAALERKHEEEQRQWWKEQGLL